MSKPITGKISTSIWHEKRKNGDIYVWERVTTYVPEARKTKELKRTLKGKIPAGSTTGEMIPTRPKRKPAETKESTQAECKRVGSTLLLEWAGKESGITENLNECADAGTAQKVNTIAQFWTANQGERLRRIEKWQWLHPTPYEGLLTKDVYHDLFVRIGGDENLIQKYFKLRSSLCGKGNSLALDSTTISTYSKNIHEARIGFNKAGDGLPTVKLVTLYDVDSGQPIAFARQPGNLADVAGIENALKQLSFLDVSKVQVITDRGYYSQSNISQMIRRHIKFLTAVPVGVSWVKRTLDENKEKLQTAASLCPWDCSVHGITVMVNADFSFERQRGRGEAQPGEEIIQSHRLYLHLFLSPNRVADDDFDLASSLMELKRDIENGLYDQLSEAAKKQADKYLVLSRKGPGGRLKVSINEEAYAQARGFYGYFALVSNKAEDCFEALRKYRLREKIEESYRDMKNRIDGHRTRVWDGDTLKGRLFCQFVGLGYHCFLQRKLKDLQQELEDSLKQNKLPASELMERENLLDWLKKQSVQSLLDWLDCIELTSLSAESGTISLRSGETKRDRLLFRLLGVPGFEEQPKASFKI